ncbi:helix-turn-helix transcriptional regulator [Sinomicrobium kalidii]|uniref:helix-turn-helix domain-containing protein n=1 Tax=Sinomicrobium kalidii TaxID=2900738 RepID=UPI001E3F4678|nr:helix-turn-helix transcriptional regulator [Sinomicrobium kalidii]UGU15098.1 helix-turn-helix transcriptional regulator [Sinomicrobium kalidii]
MNEKGQVIEIIISELDFHLIERVRELRARSAPYMSQVKLSQKLELSEGYISKVENLKQRAKYSIRILNKIAKAFHLASYSELFPEEILPHDIVRIRLRMLPGIKKGKLRPDENGNVPKAYEVLSKTPLNEEEMELWKKNKLKYFTSIAK